MSARHLRNITCEQYREFLTKAGCTYSHSTGGHEHWKHPKANRSITFSTNQKPLAELIIRNGLRVLKLNKKRFFEILED